MRVPEWEDYLKKVVSFVKFKYDRNDIYFELLGHMEDRLEDYLSEGMEQEEAEALVLENMGDAEEVGRELNKEHKPLLGWIWRISRWVLILTILVNVPFVLNMGLGVLYSVGDVLLNDREYQGSEAVYTIPVNDGWKYYDYHVTIQEVTYYEDETMVVYYTVWSNPFSRSIKWTYSLAGFGRVFDENGNDYPGGGGLSAGVVSIGDLRLDGFPEDAQQLIFRYGQEEGEVFTVDLSAREEVSP